MCDNPEHREWDTTLHRCRDCSNEKARAKRACQDPTHTWHLKQSRCSVPRKRACQDPTHTWDVKQSRCEDCRRHKEQQFGPGNRGPTECTVDYAEWCRMTGYDPATGGYTNEPQYVAPVYVSTHDEGGFTKEMSDA